MRNLIKIMSNIRLKFIFNILLISIIFNSCCKKHDENSGLIITDFLIDSIPDWKIKECCNIPNTYCIRDDSTYRKIFAITSHNAQYQLFNLPIVDFSKVSILIFKKTMTSPTNFYRNVVIDSNLKRFRYTIKTESYFCPDASGTFSFNMVIVPKVGICYKIEYQ